MTYEKVLKQSVQLENGRTIDFFYDGTYQLYSWKTTARIEASGMMDPKDRVTYVNPSDLESANVSIEEYLKTLALKIDYRFDDYTREQKEFRHFIATRMNPLTKQVSLF